jgi:hypothetical protein
VKKLFVIVTLILCGVALVFGNLHWNNKISAHSSKVTNTENTENEHEDVKVDKTNVDVSKISTNLPDTLQEKISIAADSGQPLKLVIYGSNATSNAEEAWPHQLTSQLLSAYGKDVFQVTVLSEGDRTSLDVVREKSYEEVSKLKPDAVLFEPFMMKDNGQIGISNTINNIETMMNNWRKANEGITIFIQPPNPLFAATYYPKEVSQLKDYAEKNDIIYLNHWENWPDLEDEMMKDYLTEDSQPNENGNKVWAEYLINYFIAKEK